MSKLLIINGISYDVPSKKLEYAIDTQFNYFKFPPRIKSLTVNDAINLGDTLDDDDLLTGRYTPSPDVGIPVQMLDGWSVEPVLRAGAHFTENADKAQTSPAKWPGGYEMFGASGDRADHGGWLMPEKLDMQVQTGPDFLKPNTFIVTPDMIAAGENIYFDIQVALRVSRNYQNWIRERFGNPIWDLDKIGANGKNISTEKSYNTYGVDTNNAFLPYRMSNANYDTNDNRIQNPAVDSMKCQNSALIELVLRHADDLANVDNEVDGYLTGTFKPIAETWQNESIWPTNKSVGSTNYEPQLKTKIKTIRDLDIVYREKLNAYNSLVSLNTDRSTLSEKQAITNALNASNNAKITLDNEVALYLDLQKKLKKLRSDFIKTNVNPDMIPIVPSFYGGGLLRTYRYGAERLNAVTTNREDALYKISYMIDIKNAKPWDEYYINTSAGGPGNMIFKDQTYWNIVPQSKLSSVIN
jgi:hypothetical protein